jgi:hypothetical protein
MMSERLFGVLLCVMVGAFVILIGWALYQEHEHQKFLEQHGCQVYFQAKTGHSVQTGKTSHEEVVTVYECADGKRMELK